MVVVAVVLIAESHERCEGLLAGSVCACAPYASAFMFGDDRFVFWKKHARGGGREYLDVVVDTVSAVGVVSIPCSSCSRVRVDACDLYGFSRSRSRRSGCSICVVVVVVGAQLVDLDVTAAADSWIVHVYGRVGTPRFGSS